MSLSNGTRLGPYQVVSLLGHGGMGEVYRARDTRLNRDVAIKVLPDLFARDTERLARFEREAQTLAALNHPNIAQIYGVFESGDGAALVMEFVDGADLSQRLSAGALPLPEALGIAGQIAAALTAAHDLGIVHRDLKPANVKVREDGTVKVLDFGLAKALAAGRGSDGGHDAAVMENSPTFTSPAYLRRAHGEAGSELGTILGTAAYMAPEQARGKAVDRRADVWAFGVVLYEMLTGGRPFEGSEVSDVLASVLKDPVPFDRVPAATPASIRRLLRRCLEKDRAKRLDSMTAARLEIDDAPADEPVAAAVRPAHGLPVRRAVPWVLAVVAIAVAAWLATRPTPPAQRIQLSAHLGMSGAMESVPLDRSLALSPDGRTIVFVAHEARESVLRLYLRHLDQLTAAPLAGTDGGRNPFFSPDAKWIGFFAHGKLLKVSVNGGAPIPLADAQQPRGAEWGEDDVISFAPDPNTGGRIYRIPAAGGAAVPLGPFVQGHVSQRWPQPLPGHRAIIYTGFTGVDSFEDACLVVQTLDGGAPRLVQCGGYGWRYVPTGHVLYMHGGTLFAAPFDLSRVALTGAGTPIVEGISTAPTSASVNAVVSANGVLAYVPAPAGNAAVPIETIDRAGRTTRLAATPLNWDALSFSPDGHKLAIDVVASNLSDVWVYDLDRDALTRLTFSTGIELVPIWTPDGRRITYASAQGGPPNLFWRPADGSGEEQRLARAPLLQIPGSWSPDGKTLAFTQMDRRGGYDVWVLPMDGDGGSGLKPGTPRGLVATPANEAFPAFSPDGKWLSYVSDESGRAQIYVRPFDGREGKWPISTEPATWSTWSSTRSELLFGGPDGRLMFVKYTTTGGTFRAGRAEPWTPGSYVPRAAFAPFALHPDGTRVAASTPGNQAAAAPDRFILVTDFFDEIRRKAK